MSMRHRYHLSSIGIIGASATFLEVRVARFHAHMQAIDRRRRKSGYRFGRPVTNSDSFAAYDLIEGPMGLNHALRVGGRRETAASASASADLTGAGAHLGRGRRPRPGLERCRPVRY